MITLTPFQLRLAEKVSPAEWLAQFDATPHVLPQWPKSRRMTLVGALAPFEPDDAMSQAFVVTDPQQLDAALSLSKLTWLFFSVPRAAVLAREICPEGLTAAAWVEKNAVEKKSG